MTLYELAPGRETWRRTLKVAALFWGLCLVLSAMEATVGSSSFLSLAFFVSIPALVGYLFWASRNILLTIRGRVLPVLLLGVSVLFSSSVIVLVGLLAAVNVKVFISG